MAGSVRSTDFGSVRIIPGRFSLARFSRESLPFGRRKRVPGWRIWAQPLQPDAEHFCARGEGGLSDAEGRVVLWVTIHDRLVTIRARAGVGSATVPGPVYAALATLMLEAQEKSKQLLQQFLGALDAAKNNPSRRVRGAAIQVRTSLRQGRRLTQGLLRTVWSTIDPAFGTACTAVAERTRVNAGRARTIINFYAAWWKQRPSSAPHWLDGLTALLGYPRHVIQAVANANKWWHHGRRKQSTLKAWRNPRKP